MSQEGANTLRGFRRENMLKLAGFFRDLFFVVYVKGLGKEPLRQTMAADDVFSPLATSFSKGDHMVAVACMFSSRTERHMAAIEYLLVRVRLEGVLREIDQPHALHPLQRQPHGQRAFNLYAA